MKILLYKVLIKPVLTYTSETWTLIVREKKPLAVFGRKVLRSVFGAVLDNNMWQKKVKYQFYQYFSSGMSAIEAYRHHRNKLIEVEHSASLADASVNPTKRQVYYLLDEWRQTNVGSMINSSDKLKEESLCDESLGYFGTRRTGQEIKRKWADLKSRVKAKAASLAIDADNKSENGISLKLTPVEERVLAIISQDLGEADIAHGSKSSSFKVFSFHNESNSEDQLALQYNDDEGSNPDGATHEAVIVEEIKLTGNEDKKRRITEAFSSPNASERKLGFKRIKVISEEEQLQNLCASQMEINSELRTIRDTLKKCQVSIEKIALLKRAELRLKCAKYGVEFEDLFD